MVERAYARSASASFAMSSEPGVGWLLAVLSASVPHGGRILELGTGVGVGTAWMVHGLGQRGDVEVVTVEEDSERAGLAKQAAWPAYVRFLVADALTVLDDLGRFDLIFADAQGGKWSGLDRTIAALVPGGHLLVDDMEPMMWSLPDQEAKTLQVRQTLFSHSHLICTELHGSSGIILATRRREASVPPQPGEV